MSGSIRFGLLGAALLALGVGVASAQDTQQRPQVRPGQILERVLQRAQTQNTNAVVAGAGGWTQTGVTVQRGGQLQITATGQWAAIPQQQRVTAAAINTVTDANGYPERRVDNAPLPNANFGALIGRIGPRGQPFLVGANYRGTASADGVLFLAMNDFNFEDNSGRLATSIAFTPPPPPRQPETTTQPPTQTETPTRPPVETPPPTRPPETTTPAPETTNQTPPIQTPGTPAPETPPVVETPSANDPSVTAPAEDTPPPQSEAPETPTAPAIPIAWLGIAITAGLVVLALIGNALRPRARSARQSAAGGAVGARVTDDGAASQQLTVTWKDGA